NRVPVGRCSFFPANDRSVADGPIRFRRPFLPVPNIRSVGAGPFLSSLYRRGERHYRPPFWVRTSYIGYSIAHRSGAIASGTFFSYRLLFVTYSLIDTKNTVTFLNPKEVTRTKPSMDMDTLAENQKIATIEKLKKMFGHIDYRNPPKLCPVRDVMSVASDQWSVLILLWLGYFSVLRFNKLKKYVYG